MAKYSASLYAFTGSSTAVNATAAFDDTDGGWR
jgi:hypothetical protein